MLEENEQIKEKTLDFFREFALILGFDKFFG